MDSSSGWPWPGRWPRGPTYCWPTSRPATSTASTERWSSARCALPPERGAVVVLATHDPEAAAAADGELALDEGVASWVRPFG